MSWKPLLINKPLCTMVLCVFVLSLCPPVLVADEPTIEVSESDINDLINAVNNLTPEEQQSLANSLNQGTQSQASAEEGEEGEEESADTAEEGKEESRSSSSDSDDDVVMAVSIIAGLALLYWLFRARHNTQTAGFSESNDPANIASVPLTDNTSLEFESGFIRQSAYGVSGDDLSTDDITAGSISFKVEF